MKYVADDWLAGVFGCPVFKVIPVEPILGTDLVAQARGGQAFFYTKAPTTDMATVRALTVAGFAVVEVNVSLEREPGATTGPADGCEIRDIRPGEHPAVMDIAATTFIYSRFHLDPLVPKTAADAIKREWVRNYCEKKRGDQLLVALADGEPAGFLAALQIMLGGAPVRVIDLIGVAKNCQGRGIGKAMVNRFVRDSVGQCQRVRVGTQVANIPSLRLYETCGFRIVETQYTLHAHARNGQVIR